MFQRTRQVLLAILMMLCVEAAAAPPGKPKPPKLPTLADFNKSMAAEQYGRAQKIAGVILQVGSTDDRAAVSLAYGRILLAQGKKADFRNYRKSMRKLKLRGNGELLMQVYDAWAAALAAPTDAPLQTLREIVAKQEHCEATAEAADALAILYLARGDYASAKKAVDDGLKLFAGYMPMKTAYIETLLRNRLKARLTEGQKLYEAAEKLRAARKFLEAGRLYTQVSAQYPTDPAGQAARFRVGECLVGLQRPALALDQWKKFLKDQPAGPWRGQARVAAADVCMEELDLSAAAEHIHQAAAVLDNLATSAKAAGADSLPSPSGRGAGGEGAMLPSPSGRGAGGEGSWLADHSWQDAAYDIRLRQGIVALLSQQYEPASAALKLAGSISRTDFNPLERNKFRCTKLLLIAEKHIPLLPAELGSSERGVGLALAMGRIAAVLGHYDQAGALFTAVHSGRIKGASPAHNSFAALGLARALASLSPEPAATAKPAGPAKRPVAVAPHTTANSVLGTRYSAAADAYLLSLRDDPRAAWHDETLRELGLLTERQAEKQYTEPASLAKARLEALPFWQKLIAEHATSPHCPEALCHTARIRLECEQWRPALENLEKVTKDYDATSWAGDAYVLLVDVKLERLLDLEGAQKNADAAVQWSARNPPPAPSDKKNFPSSTEKVTAGSPLPIGQGQGVSTADPTGAKPMSALPSAVFSAFPVVPTRSLRDVTYDIYVRAGLLEYLHEQFGAALGLFEKAKPFAPPLSYIVVQGHIPTGIEKLIETAKSGKSITPDIVRKGDATAKTAMMLADVYHEGKLYDKSAELCTRLLHSAAVRRASPEQRSYAHFKRARSYYLLMDSKFDPDTAVADYMAAVNAAPKSPWADEALFYAGNIHWNHKHAVDAAISVWQRMSKDYPESKETPRCMFYIGVARYWSKQYPQARKALQDFLERYPDSVHVQTARRILARCEQDMGSAARPK